MLGWFLTRKVLQDGTFRSEIVKAIDTHTFAYRMGVLCATIATTVSLGMWFIPEPAWPQRELAVWLTPQAQILAYEEVPVDPQPLVSMGLEEFKKNVGDRPYSVLFDDDLNGNGTAMVFHGAYRVYYFSQTEAGVWVKSSEAIPGGLCIRLVCATRFEAERGVFSYTAERRVDWSPFLNWVLGLCSTLSFFLLSYAWRFRRQWQVQLKDIYTWVTDWKTWI